VSANHAARVDNLVLGKMSETLSTINQLAVEERKQGVASIQNTDRSIGENGFVAKIIHHHFVFCIDATPFVSILGHGRREDRKYVERLEILARHDFDPTEDIAPGPEGEWQWFSRKPNFHAEVRAYFEGRREDL